MRKDIAKILVSEEEIDRITTRIAGEIDRDYAGEDKNLILVCILKGSIVFMGELMKKIAEEKGVKNSVIMWPVRIAAAGVAVTPGGCSEVLLLLGKEESLRRINIGLNRLKGN